MKFPKLLIVSNSFLGKKNNTLLFLMLTLAFVISSALALSNSKKVYVRNLGNGNVERLKKYPPLPVLKKNISFPILSAQGVIATDIDSGITLYEKNADAPLLPASTTKIITALVVLDNYKLDSVITVGREVLVTGQKIGLYIGEQMRVEDLLYGLLVYSGNDAAETLAYNFPGGYDAFVAAMNNKAKELNMKNTHFDNPVGLDGNYQRSTAKDLVRASEVAMRNQVFAKIVGTKQIVIHDISGKVSYTLENVNQLLGVVPGVYGVKTGWTESARENLVTYVNRDNHRIMITLLGSQDRFGETKELIDWIFSNYDWQEVGYFNFLDNTQK